MKHNDKNECNVNPESELTLVPHENSMQSIYIKVNYFMREC